MVPRPRSEVWRYFDNIVEEGVAVCKLCKQRMKNKRSFLLKRHLRKLHKAKVEVWNYFNSTSDEGVSMCKRCKQCIKNNRSVNLLQHLEVEHNIVLPKIEDALGNRKHVPKTIKRNLRSSEEFEVVNLIDDDSNEEMAVQASHEKLSQNLVETTMPNVQIRTIIPAEIVQTFIPTPISTEWVGGTRVETVAPNQIKNNFVIQSVMSIRECETSQDVQPSTSVANVNDVETPQNIHIEMTSKNSSLSDFKRLTHYTNTDKPRQWKTLLAIEMDEKTLMSAICGLITDDGVTPQLFGSKNMLALIQPICESISDQEGKEFKIDEAESEKLICSVARHLRNELSYDLQMRLLSLKIDMDLNGPANTFYVSTQFVDDGKVQSYFLCGIDLFDDRQLTEKHVKQVLHKYNLDYNQIVRICWDNTKPKFNTEVSNSEYLKEIENFEKHPDIKFGDIIVERYIGSIAQQCLLDIFKNCNIFQPFLECRNLVKFIGNKSNGFYEIFKKNNLKIPQLDSPWKWGSTYEMMNSLLEARCTLKDAQSHEDQVTFNDNLWLFVESFCESLSFMQKSILKFYKQEMHFGDFHAQWLKSKHLTAKLIAPNNVRNSHITTISVDLLKSIERKTKDISEKNCFVACLYLDPRFQHSLGPLEKSKALEYLKKLWCRLKIYRPDIINPSSVSQEQLVEFQERVDDEDSCFNEFLSQDVRETDTRNPDVYKKIEELTLPFKTIDTNILLFWNQQKTIQPEIYELAAICFAFPATQNYNQNRYSQISKTHPITKLSSSTRDNLVNIRLNSHLLKGNLEQFGILNEDKSSEDEL